MYTTYHTNLKYLSPLPRPPPSHCLPPRPPLPAASPPGLRLFAIMDDIIVIKLMNIILKTHCYSFKI